MLLKRERDAEKRRRSGPERQAQIDYIRSKPGTLIDPRTGSIPDRRVPQRHRPFVRPLIAAAVVNDSDLLQPNVPGWSSQLATRPVDAIPRGDGEAGWVLLEAAILGRTD